MRKFRKIPTLDNARDMLTKAEFDLRDYQSNYSIYSLANCLLDLYALPEWVKHDAQTTEALKNLVDSKHMVIKTVDPNIVISEYGKDHINTYLRITNLFGNGLKHPEKPNRSLKLVSTFPQTLPRRFKELIYGSTVFDAEKVVVDVFAFWHQSFDDFG